MTNYMQAPLISNSLAEADSEVVIIKTRFKFKELIVSPVESCEVNRLIKLSFPNRSRKYLSSLLFHCSSANISEVNCPVIILANSTQFCTEPPPFYLKSITRSEIPSALNSANTLLSSLLLSATN